MVLKRPISVSEFQRMNDHIYSGVNKRYSDSDLILRLLEEIAKTMEIARKDELELMPSQLARTFSWWNAVGTRGGIDLQEALWNKYPGVCPYCLRTENCACAIEHPDIPHKEQSLRRLRRDRTAEPISLSEHQQLHQKLYGRQNRRILVIQIAAHLAEEAGEISKEFRHKNNGGLADEMSDVASWIFAIANRCQFDLADTVWNQYPYECEKCHNTICNCECSDPPESEKKR
ncbi:MAG: hypothetical protein HYT63_03335 [Candidatus Yanofskybacteria bacterium]|nr:hypothetical protein [Candidatus Yanofskybacteria bacterium]